MKDVLDVSQAGTRIGPQESQTAQIESSGVDRWNVDSDSWLDIHENSEGDWLDLEGEDSDSSLGSVVAFISVSLLILASFRLLFTYNSSAAAALYATAFLSLAYWRFHWALALTFALVPFQQDLGGLPVKLAIAEVNLALLVPALLIRERSLPLSPVVIVPAFVYLAYSVSVTFARMDATALKSLLQMILYLVLAVGVFARARRSPSELVWCLDCLVVVGSLFAVVGIFTGFHFLGIHKNGWGASLSLALIVAFELWQTAKDQTRQRWLLGAVSVLTLALVLVVSRGGWLAAGVGIGLLLVLRRDWPAIGRLAIIVLPLAALGWMMLSSDLQDYAFGFEGSRRNIQARWDSVDLALGVWRESPWIGSGVGLRKEYDATNIVLLTLAESGIIGMFLFVLVHLNAATFVWRFHSYFASNSVAFSCLALGGALLGARLAHGMVDHYWSRGAILAAWAALGMAVSVVLDASDSANELDDMTADFEDGI